MAQHFFDLSLYQPNELRKELHERFALKPSPRDKLGFRNEFVDLIASERKTTTIRFRRNALDFPESYIVPVVAISDQESVAGMAKIKRLRILPFSDLNENDAIKDGFSSLADLKEMLTRIYGEIEDQELVSIYEFDYLPNGIS
jgi:hypothetical protein